MIKKRQRLTQDQSLHLFKRGSKCHSKHFLLHFMRGSGSSSFSIGIVVPKKILRGSAKRNKVRRRGYYVASLLQNRFPQPFVALFTGKRGVEKISFREFKKEFTALLSEAHLID